MSQIVETRVRILRYVCISLWHCLVCQMSSNGWLAVFILHPNSWPVNLLLHVWKKFGCTDIKNTISGMVLNARLQIDCFWDCTRLLIIGFILVFLIYFYQGLTDEEKREMSFATPFCLWKVKCSDVLLLPSFRCCCFDCCGRMNMRCYQFSRWCKWSILTGSSAHSKLGWRNHILDVWPRLCLITFAQ